MLSAIFGSIVGFFANVWAGIKAVGTAVVTAVKVGAGVAWKGVNKVLANPIVGLAIDLAL